jgi:hypothetical protein
VSVLHPDRLWLMAGNPPRRLRAREWISLPGALVLDAGPWEEIAERLAADARVVLALAGYLFEYSDPLLPESRLSPPVVGTDAGGAPAAVRSERPPVPDERTWAERAAQAAAELHAARHAQRDRQRDAGFWFAGRRFGSAGQDRLDIAHALGLSHSLLLAARAAADPADAAAILAQWDIGEGWRDVDNVPLPLAVDQFGGFHAALVQRGAAIDARSVVLRIAIDDAQQAVVDAADDSAAEVALAALVALAPSIQEGWPE